MYKLASVALTAVLGVSGIACATIANANPYVRAEVVGPKSLCRESSSTFRLCAGFYPPYSHTLLTVGVRRFEPRRWAYGWNRHFYRR